MPMQAGTALVVRVFGQLTIQQANGMLADKVCQSDIHKRHRGLRTAVLVSQQVINNSCETESV